MANNDKNKSLIKIILYLLLSLAFFTPYASLIMGESAPHRVVLEIFIFGILAIIFLYISQCLNQNSLIAISIEVLGYIFVSYFILFYLGFLLYPLIEKGTVSFIKELGRSTSFVVSSLIILIGSIITIIVLKIKLISS